MIKHTKLYRFISAFLSFCMILSLLTVVTFAADAPPAMPGTGSAPGAAPGGTSGGTVTITSLDTTDTSAYFKDLDANTSWANAYIDNLYTQGIVKGTAVGIYSPNDTLIRGDLAIMLYRRYNFATEGFSYGDVGTDAYYYQAVMRGKASGIFADTKYFYPDMSVTREDAAIWMYNCEVKKGMSTDLATSDVSAYIDGASITEEAKVAVGTLTLLGIFKGDDSAKFNPTANLTRAEMAVVFYRLTCLGSGNAGSGSVPGGSSSTIDHGIYANIATKDATGTTYESTGDSENALRVEGDVKINLNNIIINKTAGAAGSGDSSNFYGINAGLLALDGANVTINKATVNTTVSGGNGIFSYGDGTTVTVNDATIRTTKDASGGIMVTGGGTMYVNNSDIETQGGSSAALRTDRGGGTLVVKGGKYVTNGNGSPTIYSTADVTVSDATLTATTSEAIVVEGKNSVALKNCNISGKMIKNNVENLQNVMIYQSMSGDAASGLSSFTMEGGSLTGNNGDMFYVTNTSCIVKLTGVKLVPFNDILLKVVGNDARNGWGVVGSNGGQCEFTADAQTMSGKIIVDKISTLDLSMTNSTNFSGAINSENEGGTVSVAIDATSKWSLTGDVYLTKLTGNTDNIITNGFKVYVNGSVVK